MSDAEEAKPLPAFPRLQGGASTVRLQRDWTARAWVGTGARLVQIQGYIEDALARAYDDATRALPKTDDGRKAAAEIGLDLRVNVRATGNNDKLSRRGELSSILAETDPSDIEKLIIGNDPEADYARIYLLFQKDGSDGSVTTKLTVSGRDRSWVGGTAELLSSEISKGVPKWAGVRHGFVSIALGIVIGWGVAGLLMATAADDPKDWITGSIVIGAMGGGIGGVGLWLIVGQLFPGFEIVEPGATNTGRRTIAAIFALVGFLLSVAGVLLGVLAL